MTDHFDKKILECREYAAHCARKAENAGNPDIRDDFVRLEKTWLQLARSYEFAQRLRDGPIL